MYKCYNCDEAVTELLPQWVGTEEYWCEYCTDQITPQLYNLKPDSKQLITLLAKPTQYVPLPTIYSVPSFEDKEIMDFGD